MSALAAAARAVRELSVDHRFGRVIGVRGTLIEVEGLNGAAQIGSHINVIGAGGVVAAEVTGLERDVAHCLPFSDPQGIASGARAELVAGRFVVRASLPWAA